MQTQRAAPRGPATPPAGFKQAKINVMQRLTRWMLAGLILLAALGVLRLRSHTRSGSEEFASSIHTLASATIGKIVDCRTPAEKCPDEQWAYWKSATDRVLADHPRDAELHAAAAVILNRPSLGYISDLTQKVIRGGGGNSMDFARDVMNQAADARANYDALGALHASRLIVQATELDPENPKWWRLRAVMLWPPMLSKSDDRPRESDWKSMLDRARDADPGNALYDLIEARHAADSAIDFDDALEFAITDESLWTHALTRATRAASAPSLTMGEPAIHGLVRLHRLAGHPTATTIESMRSRFIGQQTAMEVSLLIRSLTRMAEVKVTPPNSPSSIEILDLANQIAKLAINRSDDSVRYDPSVAMLQVWSYQQREALVQSSATGVLESDLGLAEAIKWENNLTAASARNVAANQGAAPAWVIAASAISLASIGPWALLCVLSGAIWVAAVRQPKCIVFSLPLLIMLPFATALSFLFFGVSATGKISAWIPNWTLTLVVLGWFVCIVAGTAVRSRMKFRFSIRALLIASAVAALTIQLAFHWQINLSSLGLPLKTNDMTHPPFAILDPQAFFDTGGWWAGSRWVGEAITHWLSSRGPLASVIMVCLGWSAWLNIHRNWKREVGSFLATSMLSSLVALSVWIWIQPAIILAERPKRSSYERYIHSVHEYYAPLEQHLSNER